MIKFRLGKNSEKIKAALFVKCTQLLYYPTQKCLLTMLLMKCLSAKNLFCSLTVLIKGFPPYMCTYTHIDNLNFLNSNPTNATLSLTKNMTVACAVEVENCYQLNRNARVFFSTDLKFGNTVWARIQLIGIIFKRLCFHLEKKLKKQNNLFKNCE